jgi:hypothetical protein
MKLDPSNKSGNGSRISMLALVAGLLWPMSAFSQGQGFLTGNDLYAACNAPEGSSDRHYCTGIVTGPTDAFLRDGTMCPPGNATVVQIEDVIVKYLRDHPEKRHYTMASEAALALKQAFPCANDNAASPAVGGVDG